MSGVSSRSETKSDCFRGFDIRHRTECGTCNAKSAPYKHFRDKDALLVEVALIGTRRMEQELRLVSGLDGVST